jgi:LPS-assembly protein
VDNKVGFRSGRQIGFFIRLKAFPSFSPFGIGRRGQAIGSASGFGG